MKKQLRFLSRIPAFLFNLSGLFGWFAISALLAAAPTVEREWTSTADTKLKAVAESVSDGKVHFKTSAGRKIDVPLDKLVEADRIFLSEHFADQLPKPGEPQDSGTAPATDLAESQGETVGPLETSEGSKYLLYIPKSLKNDRKAPLLFYTAPHGGKPGNIKTMQDGAELCGWIIACSIESSNEVGTSENVKHSGNCVKHILSTLPVDPKRIYFAGFSGGAATAFANAAQTKRSAGTICAGGYLLGGGVPKGGDYFITNGAHDANRYTSANAAKTLGVRNSILRYHIGSHNPTPAWLMTEGMFWLNFRYLAGKGSGLDQEQLDFEAAVLRWIEKLKGTATHRAYHAAHLMKENFNISSANTPMFDKLVDELGSQENKRYVEGIAAMDKFGRKKIAPAGGGTRKNYTTPKLEAAAKKLSEQYAGIPEIEEIALNIGQKTGSF